MEEKQKRLGLAPIASFEDISDEVRQKMENSNSTMSKLPEIKEHACNVVSSVSQRPLTISTVHNAANITLDVHTPSTPRIDISRASSSSHHDSRDSSPENVFDQVGTGTLQETCLGGFREDGALDLRSSTEELYFMEQENSNNKVENRDQISNLPLTQVARRSPVILKLEEHQTNVFNQHQRKDSASSEVAALLSISGRTSRISSVGSQGSAVSRLSAISGISRSPSPHRMLLETSFCGPKPVVDSICENTVIMCDDSPAEILEQVLLSRRHDPTKAVLAEGIKIDLNESPKKLNNVKISTEVELKNKTGNLEKIEQKGTKTNRVRIGIDRKLAERKNVSKPIVGVTPNGTEYIRIKLKPDHLYDDKGLGKNERIVDEPIEEILRKPVSLNLNVHTNTPIERNDQMETKPVTNILLKNQSSPKPFRHTGLSRDQGSRSPSPATVSISRKSSFCSLFKSKDTIISPDSPRDRSRSKSRDRASSGSGVESIINSTPNKQKSVLAIFKQGSRKSSYSKSKTTSPVDALEHSIREYSNINDSNHHLSQVEFRFKPSQTCAFPTTPQLFGHPSRSRLRYYDAPADGAIHIPLHTPPEEKDMPTLNEYSSKNPTGLNKREKEDLNELPDFNKSKASSNKLPLSPCNLTSTLINSHLENNDEIVKIPLTTASKIGPEVLTPLQQKEQLPPSGSSIFKNDIETSNWSIEVQRHSSQESQETVIATTQKLHESSSSSINNNTIAFNNKTLIQNSNLMNDTPNHPKNPKLDVEESNNQFIANNTNIIMLPSENLNALSREKKQILFATKIGSGSEEQIFSTQFSLSKTESLSSQISESATIFEIPTPSSIEPLALSSPKLQITTNDESNSNYNRRRSSGNNNTEKVILRSKKQTLQEELSSVVEIYQEKIISNGKNKPNNRDSKYIENVDEIMEAQKKLTASLARNKQDNYSEEGSPVIDTHSNINHLNEVRTGGYEESVLKSVKPNSNHEIYNGSVYVKQSVIMTPATSSDYHGSSESEKESENGSSTSSRPIKTRLIHHHHARNLGSVIDDHESAGLVSQQSFDEDLPYIPTTLPEERARGVSLIPVKERINMEIKMCPVERPRSTTPINPASLEEYCGALMTTSDEGDNLTPRAEKLRISLPRRNSKEHDLKLNTFNSIIETKSPRRISSSSNQKNWFDFAAKQNNVSVQKLIDKDIEDQAPPPLPPRRVSGSFNPGACTTNVSSSTQQWINFEEIPEKRKIPKKITTLPTKEQPQAHHHNVQYSFVNPEDCQCECHENEKIMTTLLTHDNIILEAKNQHRPLNNNQVPPEDVQPLLQQDNSDCLDRASDSSIDYSYDGGQPSIDSCIPHTDTSVLNSDIPFGIDLSVNRTCNSNRSSATSQEVQSPQSPQESINNSVINSKKNVKCTKKCSSGFAKSLH